MPPPREGPVAIFPETPSVAVHYSARATVLVVLLFIVITTLSYADANMIAPNLDPMTEFFGFVSSTGEYNYVPVGALTSVYVFSTAGAMLFFGVLSDKYPRKWVALAGCVTYSCFSMLAFWTPPGEPGYIYLFATRAVSGFGFGTVIPTVFSLFGDLVPPERRGVVFSWFSVATLLGQALGNMIAAGATEATGDWRSPFLALGLVNLAFALLILAVREPARGRTETALAPVLSESESGEDAPLYGYTIHLRDLRSIAARKSNLWLVVNFVDAIPAAILLFLMYAYMDQVHNVPGTAAVSILLVAGVGGAIGAVVGGILGDRYFKQGNRRARPIIAIIGNIVPVPFVVVAFLLPFHAPEGATAAEIFALPGVIGFLVLIFVALLINGGVGPNWYSTLMDVNLPEHRGTMVATANTCDQVGRALAPLLGTWIATAVSITAGMFSSVVFWLALPFFWIPVMRHVEEDIASVGRVLADRAKEIEAATNAPPSSEEGPRG